MSQNYNKGNDGGHYYIAGGGQPSNVPQNMPNMNPRNPQNQQQPQNPQNPHQQPGLYQGQIPVSNAHDLKQLQNMAAATAYPMFRPPAYPNAAAMMVNPMQGHQRQNFIAAAAAGAPNMQQIPTAFYFSNPAAYTYGLAQRAQTPFARAPQPQQMHYTYQPIPQNVYAFPHQQIPTHRHTIPPQMQAQIPPGAGNAGGQPPNGINNLPPQENLAMGQPIITNAPQHPPPAQTPTQQMPVAVQQTPPIVPIVAPTGVPANPPPPIEKRERKMLKIVNPDTNENILETLEITKKTDKVETSTIPAPDYLAGGQIALAPHLPLMFDGKHFGNDPIWTPEQHLQQTTPVVSANVDGPSVVPKQASKKTPKPVNTAVATSPPPPPQTTVTAVPVPQNEKSSPVEVELDSTEEIDVVTIDETPENVEKSYSDVDSLVETLEKVTITENTAENLTEITAEEEETTTTLVETQNNQPEEVIAEITPNNSAEQKLSTSEASTKIDGDKKKLTIDEPDRALGLPMDLSNLPEETKKNFLFVMEKYQGELAMKNSSSSTSSVVNNNGVFSEKPLNEKQDPDSEDDDADKENNIQNKKSQQESTTLKPLIEYHKEQWSPDNPTGKKYYTVEQLLQLGKQVAASKSGSLKINPHIQNALISTKIFQVDSFLQKHRTNNQSSKFNLNRPSQGNRGMHALNAKMLGMQNAKQQADTIKISLSLHEDVKLKETPNAWKPKHLANDNSMSEDDRQLRNLTDNFRCVLNKLTPENFAVLLKEVKQYHIKKIEHLHACIQLIFEKAIAEPNFSVTYAEMCKQLSTICVSGGDGNTKQQFKNCLINQCQTEFENAHKIKSSKDRIDLLDKELDPVKKEELRESLEEEDYRMRKRAVGTVRFIGELYKIDLLTIKIMHTCVSLLLKPDTMDEESLECLCKLLTTVGKKMETDSRDCLSDYFLQLQNIIGKKSDYKISSRIKFMIQDLIDLRHSRWISRRNDFNPKTMGQIQKEVEREQLNIQLLNYNQGPGNMGHNQQGGRNRYDRGARGGPQMNYKPEKFSLDSKKMDFSRLGNMETESKPLGQAGFFQKWGNTHTQGANKFQNDDDREDPERGVDREHRHQQMPPPGFHHNPQHHYHGGGGGGNGPPSLPMMHPFGNNNNKQRGGNNGGDKDMYRRGSNEYRRDYRDNHHENNRYNNRGERNDSLSRSSSFNRNLGPPPGMMQNQQPQLHTSSSTLSSRLSSSSGRGSVDSHSNLYTGNRSSNTSDKRRSHEEKIIECAQPSDEKRDSLRKVFEGIFLDYVNSRENKIAIEDFLAIERKYRWAAIYECALKVLDNRAEERDMLGKLCVVYIQDGSETFTVKELIKVFGSLCEEAAVELVKDVPMIWTYIAEYLSPLLREEVLPMQDLLLISESCFRTRKGHELLLAVLQRLSQMYDFETTRDLWCNSGLTWEHFMPESTNDHVSEFVQKHALITALDKVSSNSSNNNVNNRASMLAQQRPSDFDAIERSILQFCKREHPDDTRLRQYTDEWLAKCNSTMDEPKFMRAFTAACTMYCLDEKPEPKNYALNDKRFVPVKQALKFYVYKRTSREIEALAAIQRVLSSLDYPKSLLHNIFSQLYDETVISRKGFLNWYHDKDASNRNGVAKSLIRPWFINISEEGSEHSSDDENN